MPNTGWIFKIFLNLAIVCSVVSQAAVMGQEVELALPENDPIENSTPVTSIAFSPDGSLVATGHGMFLAMLQEPSPGQTILWDTHSGKRVKTIAALKDGVHSVAFSPDGKTLAVLEYTGIIRLIAVPEGREVRKFEMNEKDRAFYSLAFFPNGQQLAAGVAAEIGGPGCDVVILDVLSGKRVRTFAGHEGPVASVAVSADGKLLASGAWDGTARIWDALTGKPLGTLTFPSSTKKKIKEEDEDFMWVQSVAFSPDGRTLAAAAGLAEVSGEVGLWDVTTAKWKATLNVNDSDVREAVFSPSGKLLVTAGSDGATKLWDAATFKESGAIEGSWPIALSADGKTVAATVNIRTVLILKTPDAQRR